MIYALLTRPPLDLTVLHDRNPLFVTMSNGEIRNGYDIKILNKTHEDREYKLSVSGLDNPKIVINTAGHMDTDNINVAADSVGQYRIFVESAIEPQKPKEIIFKLVDIKDKTNVSYETMFISER
jgi:polyferredoxin